MSICIPFLMLVLTGACPALATYEIGEEPPDFTCNDTAGDSWSLSSHRGKVVMLNFGQTASQPCDSLFAHLQPDFVNVYDPAVFTVAHIDAANQTAQQLIDYWSAYNPGFPILTQCAALLDEWGEGFVPHTVVVDPLGIVRGNWIGFYPAFLDQMHETVTAAINPTGVYVAEFAVTVSVGDDDEILEPGESAELAVTLENVGGQPATNVVAAMASSSEWITITQGASAFADMAPGQGAGNEIPFAFSIDEDAPAAMDLPVTLALDCDQGQALLHLTIAVGARVPYWSHDGESNTEAWSHSATAGWSDVWHLSTENSASPTHSWKAGSPATGTYGNHVDCRLVSPSIVLEDWSRLSFQHRMDAETSAAFPDSAYDGGTVEISTDDGSTWHNLSPLMGYPNAFRAQSGGGNPASHNFPGQTPCYSGIFSWEEAVFDLADYNGQTVRLCFHFGSDNGGSYEGWYLDDLVLAAPGVETTLFDPGVRPQALALTAWPNPFNPTTRVAFQLGESGPVRLELYDLAGRLQRTQLNKHLQAGAHESTLTGDGLASGLYLLRLETPRARRSIKLMLLR